MRATLSSTLALLLACSLTACGDDDGPATPTDGGGSRMDSGGASTDSGPRPDGSVAPGTDAGVAPGTDGGPPPGTDAGPPFDAGPFDAGPPGAGIPVGHCGARTGRYFPETSWIYTDITSAPLRSNSAAMTAWLESAGGWGNSNRFQIDISFSILDADATTPRVARTTTDPISYSSDCDPGVMVPLPAGGRIEGHTDYSCGSRATGDPDGDCHLLVADFAGNLLYEAYQAAYIGGTFYTSCTVAWDMTRDVWGAPPAPGSVLPAVGTRNWGIGRDCTGPDAAGFPIAPLLFTIGDVTSGRVEHAIRFALPNDRMQRAPSAGADGPVYVWPATHAGGPSAIDPDAPIYGSRWRLRSDFDPASRGLDPTNPVVRAVVYGLQHYGMLIADGGQIALMAEDDTGCGMSWDDLWGSAGSRVLNGIRPTDFDVLDTGGTEDGYDCTRNTAR